MLHKTPHLILACLLICGLWGCSSSSEPDPQGGGAAIEGGDASGGLDFEPKAYPFAAENCPEQFLKAVSYEGNIVAKQCFQDANGENIVLVTQKTSGEFFSPGYESKLFAYGYVNNGGGWREYWSIKEFNSSVGESTAYLEGTLQVKDLDLDQIGEPIFMYEVSPDGLDPSRVKLLMHHKGQKLALRGEWPGEPDAQLRDIPAPQIDPAFSQEERHSVLQRRALEIWNAQLERRYGN